MAFRNKITARCKTCNVVVEVGKGWSYGPPWITKCQPCSGEVEVPVKIVVTREGNSAAIKPNGFLGGDRFQVYSKCVEGARFDPAGKRQVAPLNKLAIMLDRLREANFTIDVEPSLTAHLQALTAQQKLSIQSAGARADKIDALLRERGQLLFPFQKTGVGWLASKFGALLADEMGLGKTIQALAALPDNAPVLVICPAVAKGTWRKEAAKWRPEYKVTVLSGRGNFCWPEKGEIVVINFDILPNFGTASDLLTVTEHNELAATGQAVEVDYQDTIQFKVDRKAGKFFASLELSDNGKDWFGVKMWDDMTPAGDERKYEVPYSYRIPTPPPELQDAAHERAGQSFVPKFARVVWSSTESAKFGVTHKPKKLKAPPLVEAPEGLVLLVDEVHAVKSSKAARTVKFRALSEGVRRASGYVWGLTGTPLLNKQPELWSVLQALGCAQDAFGSWNKFVEIMGGYQDTYGYVWPETSPNQEEVGERLKRVMLRRLRTEVLPELPGKMWKEIPVDLDAKTAKYLDKVLANLDKFAGKRSDLWDSLAGLEVSEMGEVHRERRAASNGSVPGFEEMSQAREALALAKIPSMLAIVDQFEEAEEPLVVFSAHLAPIKELAKREGWAVITGSTSSEERSRIEGDFQAGKLKGIGATIKAGGVAITLTRAHHALFVDLDWTPALNAQAEDRICRIGQDRGCIIMTLVAEHALDQRVFELLTRKRNIINSTVEQARQVNPNITVVDLDLEAMASRAREEAEAADKARAEAQEIAKEREKKYASEKERKEAEEKERKEQEKKAEKERKARERATKRGWVAPADAPERQEARTPRQRWAMKALLQLTADDPDFASAENGVGFNKSDAVVGHWLSQEMTKGFTPRQWALVIHLCAKYHGQVGEMPAKDDADVIEAVT